MSRITSLGDVALLKSSIRSEYEIAGEYIFNLEYVLTENPSTYKTNILLVFNV